MQYYVQIVENEHLSSVHCEQWRQQTWPDEHTHNYKAEVGNITGKRSHFVTVTSEYVVGTLKDGSKNMAKVWSESVLA